MQRLGEVGRVFEMHGLLLNLEELFRRNRDEFAEIDESETQVIGTLQKPYLEGCCSGICVFMGGSGEQ